MDYTNMDLIVQYDFVVSCFSAAIVSIGTLRFIRLLRFNRNVMTMLATLRHFQSVLLSFMVVFLTVFLAFAGFGYLSFHTKLYNYSTFISALETLFSMALGKFDVTTLQSGSSTIGPIFFCFYSLFVSIVMTNFLVAFIMVGYEYAMHDESLVKEEAEVFSFMFLKMKRMLGMAPARESSLAMDRKFKYSDNSLSNDEVERFTEQMEELMERIDKHLENTKQQFPNMFDQNILKRQTKQIYITE